MKMVVGSYVLIDARPGLKKGTAFQPTIIVIMQYCSVGMPLIGFYIILQAIQMPFDGVQPVIEHFHFIGFIQIVDEVGV
jgi:hypothetical protein